MNSPDTSEGNNQNPLIENEQWLICFEPILRERPAKAESLVRLLFTLKQAIESGTEGIALACDALKNGIELAYLHTDAHKAALKLYVLSLEGNLKPQDEPIRLINAAIERGKAETKEARS